MHDNSPKSVVQRQLDAYNDGDLDAWLATYADNARQYEYPAQLIADGKPAIRQRALARFAEPGLHARLLQRAVMGEMVIDHKRVARHFDEGPGSLEVVAIYQVRNGVIVTASFINGTKTLD